MKKTIIIALATAGFSVGAFAQGSIAGLSSANNYYVTTGVGQTSPNTATAWYSGNLSLEVFFSSTANAGDITTLNNLDGTAGGGAAALADLSGFGFSEVSLTGNATTSVGAVSGAANSGNNLSGFPNTVVLSTAFGSSAAGFYALYFAGAGAFSSYSAVVAFTGNYGGQQVSNPTSTPFAVNSLLNGMPNNLDLTATPTPEPGTMALAGLGGIGMLLAFRRKQAKA